jgi:glycerophosphoryl diester phosphodiesterase
LTASPTRPFPLILAHRGASAYSPENTFAAFDFARDLAAPAVETDVRATRDGALVLLHDATVDRTTNGHGAVADLTLAELKALDAGGWFAPRFAGQTTPTLAEFLARYGTVYPACIEVKSLGIERQVLDAVEAARPAFAPTFTAFEFETVENLCRLAPDAVVGYLSHTFDLLTIERTRAAGARQICPKAADLTPDLIDAARAVGLAVRAWGVGDDELLERAISLGVDGLTTNWPDRGLRLVAKYFGRQGA